MREELTASKRELESQLHAPVEALAYPYNSVRKRIERAAAEAGYRVAVAGVAHGGKGLLNLYRVSIRRSTSLDEFKRLTLGG